MKILVPSYVEERDGQLYAGDSRIPVTTIIVDRNIHLRTPEEIHEDFPTLSLATIYGVVAYYLDHQQEIDEQIRRNDELFERMLQAQLDDVDHPATALRQQVEEIRRQNRGQDEAHP